MEDDAITQEHMKIINVDIKKLTTKYALYLATVYPECKRAKLASSRKTIQAYMNSCDAHCTILPTETPPQTVSHLFVRYAE